MPIRVATKYLISQKAIFQPGQDSGDYQTERFGRAGAKLTGLSDVIIDIVESGRTLKENGLVVLDELPKAQDWWLTA